LSRCLLVNACRIVGHAAAYNYAGPGRLDPRNTIGQPWIP